MSDKIKKNSRKEQMKTAQKLVWKEKISNLRSFIFNGQYENCEKWFKLNPIKPEDEDSFLSQLYDESYLFSFRLNSMDKNEYLHQSFKRESVFLKNVSANIAIQTLTHVLFDMNIRQEHIDILLNKKDLNQVSQDSMACLLFKLLNQKVIYSNDFNFSLVMNFKDWPHIDIENKIESKRQFDGLNLKKFNYIFKYGEGGTMFFNLNCDDLEIEKCSLWVDLVANFSMDKLRFFKENNIFLPSVRDIGLFYNHLENHMQGSNYARQEDIKLMINRAKQFEASILNDVLNENLSEKTAESISGKKSIKI